MNGYVNQMADTEYTEEQLNQRINYVYENLIHNFNPSVKKLTAVGNKWIKAMQGKELDKLSQVLRDVEGHQKMLVDRAAAMFAHTDNFAKDDISIIKELWSQYLKKRKLISKRVKSGSKKGMSLTNVMGEWNQLHVEYLRQAVNEERKRFLFVLIKHLEIVAEHVTVSDTELAKMNALVSGAQSLQYKGVSEIPTVSIGDADDVQQQLLATSNTPLHRRSQLITADNDRIETTTAFRSSQRTMELTNDNRVVNDEGSDSRSSDSQSEDGRREAMLAYTSRTVNITNAGKSPTRPYNSSSQHSDTSSTKSTSTKMSSPAQPRHREAQHSTVVTSRLANSEQMRTDLVRVEVHREEVVTSTETTHHQSFVTGAAVDQRKRQQPAAIQPANAAKITASNQNSPIVSRQALSEVTQQKNVRPPPPADTVVMRRVADEQPSWPRPVSRPPPVKEEQKRPPPVVDLMVEAMHDFAPTTEGQLPFKRGNLIRCYRVGRLGWIYGENIKTNVRGWFPQTYTSIDNSLRDYADANQALATGDGADGGGGGGADYDDVGDDGVRIPMQPQHSAAQLGVMMRTSTPASRPLLPLSTSLHVTGNTPQNERRRIETMETTEGTVTRYL